MMDLMLSLKEAEIRKEAIPVHMNQGKNTTKNINNKGETTIVMIHAGHINESEILRLPTE